ncbi:MAG: tetratricopeptide repeat protein, partial [Planctomycetaceae bacterium]
QPQMVEAYVNLANVYRDMGNTRQAIEHYRRALELDPSFERAQRGLAEAQDANDQAEKALSPFGRLVEDPATTTAKDEVHVVRELSDRERLEDRQAIATIGRQVEQTAKTFLSQLQRDLAPTLFALDRAVAQANISPGHLITAHEQFQGAVNRSVELRKKLKRRILELRGHEELINTPQLTVSK